VCCAMVWCGVVRCNGVLWCGALNGREEGRGGEEAVHCCVCT
jgi:hypothetical protein